MIRYQEMVPEWYPEKSRDFQILGRMFDYVLNSAKYNIDSMSNLTDTRRVKNTVLPLLGDMLGIYDKESYSNRHMLEALPIAIKYKGSLKSVHILLNAFLDSLDIFNNAMALYARDKETAQEISDMLNRKIQPYTIVIILSAFPNLTNLHVLDTYLKMVIPTGMLVEYAFGVQKTYLDKFKYKEYVFLYYTSTRTYEGEGLTVPMVGMVAHMGKAPGTPGYENDPRESYSSAFVYAGTDNVRTRREFVGDEKSDEPYIIKLKHTAVPIPPSTEVKVYKVTLDAKTGNKLDEEELIYEPSGEYSIRINEDGVIVYIEYSFNKTKEFVEKLNEDGFDVNAVSIGTIMSKDQIEDENE